MKYLTLFLTELCNRKCPYCDIGNMKERKNINEDLLNEFLPLIADSKWESIVLTGGEPTLIGEELLSKILITLKDKYVKINTNGELFWKKLFVKYDEYIDKVQYHPVSEINQTFVKIDDPKVIHYFPLHHKNVKYLKKFLEYMNKLPVMFTPYDDKIGDDSYNLTKEDCKEIYDLISKTNNVTEDTVELFRLLSINPGLDLIRNFCFNNMVTYPSIDFVNGRIDKCIRSHTRSDWKPLTVDNFHNIKNLWFDDNKVCKECCLFLRDRKDIIKEMIC